MHNVSRSKSSIIYSVGSDSHPVPRGPCDSYSTREVCSLFHVCNYMLDVGCAVMAALSGFHTTIESAQENHDLLLAVAVREGLTRMAGGEFRHNAVFACRVVSPSIYAASWQYLSKVSVFHCVFFPVTTRRIRDTLLSLPTRMTHRFLCLY